MFDVAICFRTSFIDHKTEEEQYDLKVISNHYLKGRFWADLLASLPFDFISLVAEKTSDSVQLLNLFGLLKLIRVLRISRIIMYLNAKENVKLTLKLVNIIFFLILYVHCQGCVWWLIVNSNEQWVPPYDFLYVQSWIFEDTLAMKYWTAIYHSTSIVAANDISPRNIGQLIFCVVGLLTCAIINANILGNITMIVTSMNKKVAAFQEKLDTVNTAMNNMHIPNETMKKVQNYIMSTQGTLENQQEMEDFLELISPSLRLEVTKHIFSQIVVTNSLFGGNEELIDYLIKYLITSLFLPEDIIINQGDFANDLFFLARGEVNIFIYDEDNEERYVNTLKIGAYFGEVGIIKD